METILSIAALVVLALVVTAVSRRLRKSQTEAGDANVLPAFVAAFLVIFALVSLCAASNIAGGAATETKVILFLFIVANGVLASAVWRGAQTH